jgi:hypothetical protein
MIFNFLYYDTFRVLIVVVPAFACDCILSFRYNTYYNNINYIIVCTILLIDDYAYYVYNIRCTYLHNISAYRCLRAVYNAYVDARIPVTC